MSALTEDNYKKIKLVMKDDTSKEFFDMPGVSNLCQEGNDISFLYRGNPNEIIRKISQADVGNILIEEPSLEEIFMHYYDREG